jgi:phosphatidate cytidylyltransferase
MNRGVVAMKQRIITGVLGAAGFLLLLFLGGWWYTGLLFILATIAYMEYSLMTQAIWNQPQVLLGLLLVWLIFFIPLLPKFDLADFPLFQDANLLLAGLILFFLLIVLSKNKFDIQQMSFLFVGCLYIGFGFSFMMNLIWQPNGLALSLLILWVTWATDSGAYFIGKQFGKRKLWPAISPNKTVEGSLGGVFCGVLFALLVHLFVPDLGDPWKVIGMGLVVSVVGQLGDLVESAIKRFSGVKDSGKILPGHGGVLDRFDSLLFTFLVMHVLQMI